MTPKYYHIIFRGETLPGFQIEAVKQKLAAAFKLGPEHTNKLFVGKPVLMAKNVDLDKAAKYKKIFENAGAVCEAVSADSRYPIKSMDKVEKKSGNKPISLFSGKDEKSLSISKPSVKRSALIILIATAIVFLIVGVIIWYYLHVDSILSVSGAYKNGQTTGIVWPLSNFEMVSILVSICALSLLILTLRKRLAIKNPHDSTVSYHTAPNSESVCGHQDTPSIAMRVEDFGKELRSARLIWGVMFSTLPIYVGICHVLGQDLAVDAGPNFPQGLLEKILCGVAVGMIMIAGFLRKLMLKAAKNGVGTRLFKSTTMSEAPTISAKYISAVIVSLALAESSAIYGVILFILGSGVHILYLLVGLAAVAMIIYRPKCEELAAFLSNKQF
jgi:hypothetical protein